MISVLAKKVIRNSITFFLWKIKKYVILIIGVSMIDMFLQKLNNHEYITTSLYKYIKMNEPQLLPLNFDLENYNEKVINDDYQKYKNYFETMYQGIDDNIILDEEQIKAILTDDDYSLIIAGAGTGKTTTMASKVKYLVDIKKVDPSKIVVMSYTRKATEELKRRIVDDFNINANVTTFHSLGFTYIREIFKNRKCYVVDQSLRREIFYNYFKTQIFPYKNKITEIIDNFEFIKKQKKFLFGRHFIQNYDKFDNYDDYFEQYKKDKMSEIEDLERFVNDTVDNKINSEFPTTIQGEFVKSKGEAIIANFLYCNNIEYYYEKIYTNLMPNRKTYKPDFTLNLGGEEVYIEYFGLSSGNVTNFRYEKNKQQKINYHKKHHNKFIGLDYVKGEELIKILEKKLLEFGFKLRPRNYLEIYNQILDNNQVSQIYPYEQFLYQMIDIIKSSKKRQTYMFNARNYIKTLPAEEALKAQIQLYYIHDFYEYYQNALYGLENYGFDYSDMIYYANLYMDSVYHYNVLNFDYLIIDEYQDISQERYEFTQNIVYHNKAKVVAVGDDWQSIFSFAGSKIEYIYNFQKYFKDAKLLKINHTYRNSQDLINYSGRFIMKNDHQIKKQLISDKVTINPIRFIMFENDEEYQVLKKLILKIHYENPTHKIMILGRTNKIIDACYDDPDLKDEMDTKIRFVGYDDIEIDGMTLHSSKGLTTDEVILIGLNQFFPYNHYNYHWFEYLFKEKPVDEGIPFAEERRLFYVGLTRTKNHVYLLVNKDPRKRSPFIDELFRTIKEA